MKRLWLLGLAVVAVALPGCLTYERSVLRATFDPERGYGAGTQVFYSIQSTEDQAEAQQVDFRDLIGLWKEDRYLVDMVHDEHLYVRSRDLRTEGGVLVGSQSVLFKELSAFDIEGGPGDTLSLSLADDDFEVVRTNGHLTGPPDSSRVWWPPGTTTFEVEVRVKEFEPRSDFVKLFRDWSRRH